MPEPEFYVMICRETANILLRWRFCVLSTAIPAESLGSYPEHRAAKSGVCFSERGARRRGRRALRDINAHGLPLPNNRYILKDDEDKREFERIQRELKRKNKT